jgi:hypothetical protein
VARSRTTILAMVGGHAVRWPVDPLFFNRKPMYLTNGGVGPRGSCARAKGTRVQVPSDSVRDQVGWAVPVLGLYIYSENLIY